MAKIVFNIARLQIKLIMSLIIIVVFAFLYKTVPASEFGKESISNLDIFYYSLVTHLGIQYNRFLDPLSIRAKILAMIELILGFSIIIL